MDGSGDFGDGLSDADPRAGEEHNSERRTGVDRRGRTFVRHRDRHGYGRSWQPSRYGRGLVSSTDRGEKVVGVTNGGNGTYRALISSSTTPGEAVITATDISADLSVVRSEPDREFQPEQDRHREYAVAGERGVDVQCTSTYTMVRLLVVTGVPLGSDLRSAATVEAAPHQASHR